MKTYLAVLLGASMLTAPVMAADVYGGSTLKDATLNTAHVPQQRGGLGIRVFLGYSWGDREVSQRNSGELGFRDTPKCEGDGCEELDAETTDFVNQLNTAGVDASWDGATFELPLLRVLSSIAGGDDISSLSGGAEVEYIVYAGSIAYGLVGGVQLYADADSRSAYSGAATTLGGGSLISPRGSAAEGATVPGLTTSGFVEVDRTLDLDLKAKLGFLADQNTLIYVVGGPSLAKGKIKGSVSIDGIDGSLTSEDDQWSLGWVAGIGVQRYMGNGWSLNLEGDYREHEFDVSQSVDKTLFTSGTKSVYGKASSTSEAEDGIYSIKLGLTRHF